MAVIGTRAPPQGLSQEEESRRRAEVGPNRLPRPGRPSVVALALRQLTSPLSALLVVAAVATVAVLHQPAEGAAIAAIVVLNVAIGVAQEHRSAAALDALDELVAPVAKVWRDGRLLTVDAIELVPGDIVELAAGDRVPADVCLDEAASLASDEAVLTGESMPVEKVAGIAVDDLAPPSERPGEAFAGTLIVRGRGRGVVVRTGAATHIGRIAGGLGREPEPPLVGELRSVAARLSAVAVLLGGVLVIGALARGEDASTAVLAGVALAVAAIPEGLATVVTTALALGARRMARRGAIVRHLPAIETLGSASLLCTDKTGTLTTGHVVVAGAVAVPGREVALWTAALRCNDADGSTGDPLDVALFQAALDRVTNPLGVRIAERPFDATARQMRTVHSTTAGPVLSVKGAPEVVLAACRGDVTALAEHVEELTGRGQRVLALATASTDDVDADGLDALGVVAFEDPLRPSTRATVATCRAAGVRVVVVTGDHAATARSIAAAAGLDTEPIVTGADLAAIDPADRDDLLRAAAIVARVEPETKVALVDAHRGNGEVVAMTGDGVNDAPALRRADIGVALAGAGGTDVARAAAGVVVTDGNLGTLVDALREGRRIYRAVSDAISYLVAGNLSEILVLVGALFLVPELAIPLLPVQLLWVNFVTDGVPALALGLAAPVGDPLAGRPRPRDERLLTGRRQLALLERAAFVAAPVLAVGAAVSRAGWSAEQVRTELLLGLLAGHLVLAWATRARRWTFERGWATDRPLLLGVLASLAIQVPVFGTAAGRSMLGLAALPASGWLLVVGTAATTVALIDAVRAVSRRRVRP